MVFARDRGEHLDSRTEGDSAPVVLRLARSIVYVSVRFEPESSNSPPRSLSDLA
mgnify:FL=1|jgi:hypothetical protein